MREEEIVRVLEEMSKREEARTDATRYSTYAHSALMAAVDLIKAKAKINTSYRLFDLVRYMRSELHDAGLIDDKEYAWITIDAEMAQSPEGGSPSRQRLEDYDELRAKWEALGVGNKSYAELQHEINKLKEEVAQWADMTPEGLEEARKIGATLTSVCCEYTTMKENCNALTAKNAELERQLRMTDCDKLGGLE